MEPILKNPCFPSLLRTWKFFTTYHEYLELPNTFTEISLYEFDQHIRNDKYKTLFTAQLIEALVRKTSGSEKKKQQTTALYLAKENKHKFFEELLKTSAYELGLTEVTFALVWRDQKVPPAQKAFEQLSLEDKYANLSMLVDLVSTNSAFKKTYMESLKADYTAATEVEGRVLLDLQKKFVPKMTSSIVLGKDSSDKCYFYMSKIGDSILECNLRTKIWRRIQGHDEIKNEILDKIINRPDSITNEEVDLLQQISDIWNRIGWNMKYTAFDHSQKLFDINQAAPKIDKLKILKQKLHQVDQQYTKFISDCFNFRWASKQRRISFHKQIDEAKSMSDLVTCFSKFFHETRHSIQKKLKTLDFYDPSLDTDDVAPDQFKVMFLHTNYLYSKGVISEAPNTGKYTNNLYHHIKSFLEDSQKFEPFFFEYLTIFVESMLGIIKEMYPAQYNKRLKLIQKLEEEEKSKKQKQEEEEKNNKHKKSKLNRAKSQISENQSDQSDNEDSEDEMESETTVEKKGVQAGRRLRQKVKINYKIQVYSNDKKKNLKPKQPSKPVALPSRQQPGRNAKGGKKNKMNIDSDSESEDSISLSVSDRSESTRKSGGLNLDHYKYEDSSPKVTLRRNTRSKERRR